MRREVSAPSMRTAGRAEIPAPSDLRGNDGRNPERRLGNSVDCQPQLEGAGQASLLVPPPVCWTARKDLKPFGCGGGASAAEWTAWLLGSQVLSLSLLLLPSLIPSRLPLPGSEWNFAQDGGAPARAGWPGEGRRPQAPDPRLRPVWRAPRPGQQPSGGQGKFSGKFGQAAWRDPEP